MRCGNRRRRRLLQQMSRSRNVHTVDASSQQISRRNVRKQIVYKIRIPMVRKMAGDIMVAADRRAPMSISMVDRRSDVDRGFVEEE